MKRQGIAVLAALLLFAVAPAALAHDSGNPHFIKTSAKLNADLSLTATFKEAGLGQGEDVVIQLRADASSSAEWQCYTRGQTNDPQGAPHEETGPFVATGTFSAGRNGQVNGSLTLTPTTTFDCVPGLVGPILISVEYNNVTLTDVTHNVTVNLGSFSG
jgi:hypothetical protein